MKKVLAVVGPTGSGKSDFSIKLAERLDGEIINCDSVQLYRGFNIGADKVSPEIRKKIPHHFIDIISNCRRFSAAEYAKLASKKIREISSRGKFPILVGGTFLYLRALEKGLFPVGTPGEEFRRRWKEHTVELWKRAMELDPEYYIKIGGNDVRRMVRLMEVFYLSGKNMTENFALTKSPLEGWKFVKIGIKRERGELYRRIERRVDEMFKKGIIEEVRKLLALGYPETCPPFEAIGYREILAFVKGEISMEEARRLIKKNTKEYARRQLMWLRKEPNIIWVSPEDIGKVQEMVRKNGEN